MLPSVLSSQIQSTLEDYLRTTFKLRNAKLEKALFAELRDPERGLFRGPYVDVRLPFRKSAEDYEPPIEVRPPWSPYQHQLISWQRLASKDRHPQSTLVTTGTGSGKTECFLYPVLDHCYRHREQRGIKAIILYPMNALASDQAERLAKEIWNWGGKDDPKLRNTIRAGLYVGGKGSHPKADELHLVDDREQLRKNPPDILLTNYRMLDFLLLRPQDHALWRFNSPGSLKYLVLDELHTYDGAQGSDVACLIRRLKARLGSAPGSLCCVGTSATIGSGGDESLRDLATFASTIFGEEIGTDAIVLEDRQNIAETLGNEAIRFANPIERVADGERLQLDPATFDAPLDYLNVQAGYWLGPAKSGGNWLTSADSAEERIALGVALAQHRMTRDVLAAITGAHGGGPVEWRELVKRLPDDSYFDAVDEDTQWLGLASFLSLLAHARKGSVGRPEPFLTLQLQLWLREMRGLLQKVPAKDDTPGFAWREELEGDDGHREEHYLPMVYCRECGTSGLASVQLETENHLKDDVRQIGTAYLRRDSKCRFVLPYGRKDGEFQQYLCPKCLKVEMGAERCACSNKPVDSLPVSVHGDLSEQKRFLGRCPHCNADDGLTMLASRAASLSSVAISHLFLSPFNADKKLLAFTDSVQDASHRAGFFAGRTYRFNLRTAMQAVLEATDDDVTLDAFVSQMLKLWEERLENTSKGKRPGRMAATLLPPDLREDPTYAEYIERLVDPKKKVTGKVKNGTRDLLAVRLSWEVVREFGLGVVIGRSLERTGTSTLIANADALDRATDALHTVLVETRPVQFKGELSKAEVRHYLEGLVQRTRRRGGVYTELLGRYVKYGSPYFLSKFKEPRLSRFGPRSVLPRFIYSGRTHQVFDPLPSQPTQYTWFRDWTARSLNVEPRDAGINGVLQNAVRFLTREGLLAERETKGTGSPKAWGVEPANFRLTRKVAQVVCDECGDMRTLGGEVAARWDKRACLNYRCKGHYGPADKSVAAKNTHYYSALYRAGHVHRIFAGEHTGLLEREDREQLERDFKDDTRPDAPNLLTCTPTLEMGIDIGDLSAVMLCSVPPMASNFLQRVGRAGRSTGNALVLTIANARPHDRYFFEDPMKMIKGHVAPPGCFLDAPEMLQRQLAAHAMDWWAQSEPGVVIPRRMGNLLGEANKDGFPKVFYNYYAKHKAKFTDSFFAIFGSYLSEESRAALEGVLAGDVIPKRMDEAFKSVKVERDKIKTRIAALDRRLQEIESDPRKAVLNPNDPGKSKEDEQREIEFAKRAYEGQIKQLYGKHPLNVLTDEGILPNYAFPEPGVTLRSMLRGHQTAERAASKGKEKIRVEKSEYMRPASSAIREFAPFNYFYADGHKVRITQLEVGNKANPVLQSWRLCRKCHYSEREVESAQVAEVCPRCSDHEWKDQGRLRDMVHFRQAWSNTSLMEATAADDTEERQQESYKLVQLIDVGKEHLSQKARLVETDELVFGYEWLRKVTLREVNFGRTGDVSQNVEIAGENVAQPGFTVCATCGRVQDGGAAKHMPYCKVRTGGAKEEMKQVSLYRELTSEAIRVLLPVSSYEVNKVVPTFAAALELGFRRKFKGQPVHLKVTTASEPSGESYRRFLVIYDAVPGGTGYLADLWRDDRLFEVMQLALNAMRECECNRAVKTDETDETDETTRYRDGCYRCVYAHQHSRDLENISRSRAVRLFEDILSARTTGGVKEIPSLSEVTIDSLLESELEVRFIGAMGQWARSRGYTWENLPLRGKDCWRLTIGEKVWDVEPQVELGPKQGVEVMCKPDFVLHPRREASGRKIAVFTDGFQFHVCPNKENSRIADDIRKRLAILDAFGGQAPDEDKFWVWSLTWTDVARPDGESKGVNSLLGKAQAKTFAALATKLGGDLDRELVATESFELLCRYLEHQDGDTLKRTALAAALSRVRTKDAPTAQAVADYRTKLRTQPSHFHVEMPRDKQVGEVVSATMSQPWVQMLVTIGKEHFGRNLGHTRFTLRLFDEHEARKAENFEPSWRSFLQAFNVLQFHEGGFELVSSEYLSLAGLAAEPETVDVPAGAAEETEVEAPPTFVAQYAEIEEVLGTDGNPLIETLGTQGLSGPVLEHFLFEDEEDPVAALAWPELKVGLVYDLYVDDEKTWKKHGWVVFDVDKFEPQVVAAAVASRSTQQ